MTNLSIIFFNKCNQVHSIWTWLKKNPFFLTFIVFASFIFAKLFYFHFSIEQPAWPQSISLLILPKLAISLLASSFILITKNKWWTIPVSLLVDIWVVSNIIYYRASGFFINTEALQMIDNMRGFWDSILIYFSWEMFIPFLLTLLYSIFIIKSHLIQSTRHKSLFILIILFSFSMRIFVNCFQHSVVIKDYWVRNEKNNIESIWKIIRPVVDSHFEAYDAARRYFNHGIFTDWEKQYVIQNTILDFFFANVSYYISKKYYKNKTIELKQYVELVPSDKEIINDLITIDSSLFAPPLLKPI